MARPGLPCGRAGQRRHEPARRALLLRVYVASPAPSRTRGPGEGAHLLAMQGTLNFLETASSTIQSGAYRAMVLNHDWPHGIVF